MSKLNVSYRSAREVETYRAQHRIGVMGDAPRPITRFDEANLPDYVMDNIRLVPLVYSVCTKVDRQQSFWFCRGTISAIENQGASRARLHFPWRSCSKDAHKIIYTQIIILLQDFNEFKAFPNAKFYYILDNKVSMNPHPFKHKVGLLLWVEKIWSG